jgi:hypothetical protein
MALSTCGRAELLQKLVFLRSAGKCLLDSQMSRVKNCFPPFHLQLDSRTGIAAAYALNSSATGNLSVGTVPLDDGKRYGRLKSLLESSFQSPALSLLVPSWFCLV